MSDRRRHTGTQNLQVAWTLLLLAGGVLAALIGIARLDGGLAGGILVVAFGLLWLGGLVGLGLRERRHWNRMVEATAFERESGTRLADLEKLLGGRSVVVSTVMPSLRSQTHTEIRTPVEDVDASFTIEIEYVGDGDAGRGLRTGNEALDERFVIGGAKRNVKRLLSPDVQAALMDVRTVGTCTVTGSEVCYLVPFTRLTPKELDTLSDTIVVIAERVEELAKRTPGD